MSRYERNRGEPWPEYVARAAKARPWGCGQGPKRDAEDAVNEYYRMVRCGHEPSHAAVLALQSVGSIGHGDDLVDRSHAARVRAATGDFLERRRK